jgi:predicted secreted Zn-dependent protease
MPPRAAHRRWRSSPAGALLLSGLLLCAKAGAELSEALDYSPYEVPMHGGDSLRALLNAASPVRINGGIYHAYTQWDVHWHYRYAQEDNGRCGIAGVRTELTATMTLPAPSDPAIARNPVFIEYLAALKRHEQGHYEIGRRAAAAIDAGILALPVQDSCDALGRAANEFASTQLARAREIELRYDRDTGSGRTQGAWLK